MVVIPQRNNYDIVQERAFKKGLAMQRELFKSARNGTGTNNFDLMADCLENLKNELRSRIEKNGGQEEIKKVQKVLKWYRNLEMLYSRRTPRGNEVIFPPDIEQKTNQYLSRAYEILVEQMDVLDLL